MDMEWKNFLSEFAEGTCLRAYDFLGCHAATRDEEDGYIFRVWAPDAIGVSVVGDFNYWNTDDAPMTWVDGGMWECFCPGAKAGQAYKFYVRRRHDTPVYKSDPYGRQTMELPDTSNIIPQDTAFPWTDRPWMKKRAKTDLLNAPMNIYEVHMGSWRRGDGNRILSYEEVADRLADYCRDMGYTHVEFMPLSEYPYDPSWGYQVTGYYAPTHRYGKPEGLKYLVNKLHGAGIGVILDWVPAHYPKDENGLYEFDGSCCYELSDPSMNEHPDWTTRIFDFGKPQVKSFLVSNAVYWLEEFHFDGLRVDAVSSMLYLDYNRPNYKPNRFGGRDNLEAMDFLRAVNRAVRELGTGAAVIAEESTAFPMVTGPEEDGGLGFTFKWNMGWMNDTLRYLKQDPIYRKYNHDLLTFGMTYAFSENYVMPLSHDEVVHMKGSLIRKMPGDYDQQFATLRTLYAYMMALPGKKLTFMGSELGQFAEWNFGHSLDWHLLNFDKHRMLQKYVRELNRFYLEHDALWRQDHSWDGFQWIQPDAADDSILAFRRISKRKQEVICVLNFTPVDRWDYRLGLPKAGTWVPVLCSDFWAYGGYNCPLNEVTAENVPFRDYKLSGLFRVPPLSAAFYIRKTEPRKAKK